MHRARQADAIVLRVLYPIWRARAFLFPTGTISNLYMVANVLHPTSFRFMHLLAMFLVFAGLCLSCKKTSAQQATIHHGGMQRDGMSMPVEGSADPAAQAKFQAKIVADKRESEFNHHLAGFCLLLAAFSMMFLQSDFAGRWPVAKYVWPLCFLLAGVFVLVWSDTELWPFGNRQWLEALRNNREVLQHKTFAVLLLALGIIEWRRACGVLRAAWSAWVFPAAAVLGSIILIFHEHQGGMVGENHMETMAHIRSQHLSYTLSGMAIGVSKGLSELNARLSRIFAKLWPLLLAGLGILLMFYRE